MLAIIILNWNQVDDTLGCLRAVEAWPAPARLVWVVDNASPEVEAQRIAQAYPSARLIRSQANRGFAGGNNLALAQALAAGCDEILLLNNDVAIEAAGVAHLRQALQAHPQVGIIGPVLWDSARPGVLLSAGGLDIAHHVSSHVLEPLPADAVRYVAYVPGTCVLIRAAVLQAAGLLDEDYFFGGEVADLCKRAEQHGFLSAVDGGAHAHHHVERSSDLRRRLHVYYVIRNRFLFVRKFYRRRQAALFAFWTAYGFYTGLLALAQRDGQRARAIALACVDGWRGRFGGQNERVTGGQIT